MAVRPLVGLNVLLFLFSEQEKDGVRWSEREGGGCEGTSTNPTMLKDTTNKHLIDYTKYRYPILRISLSPRYSTRSYTCDMIPMKETNGDFLIQDKRESHTLLVMF